MDIKPAASSANRTVVIFNAGADVGCRLARRHLEAGHRVVITSAHATDLPRVMHGFGADQLLAIAADMDDERQRQRVMFRARERFGRIDEVVDTRADVAAPARTA
jgi:short-subunit dehydrogenase involved in D-alanine esterification of teichoic acids